MSRSLHVLQCPQLPSVREVALVPFFCLRKLKLRGTGPPAGVFVRAAALAPGRPGRPLPVSFGPSLFLCLLFPSCFFTLVPLTGAAAHLRLCNRRAPALRAPCSVPKAGAVEFVSAGFEPQNRWNPALFEVSGPCEHNHFLSIWKLWPLLWPLPSDTQEVGLDLWSLGPHR